MMPPSPPLSARRMKVTYLIDTIRVIAQNTREMTPYTSSGAVPTALLSAVKTVWIAYRGLVPMSPKTTPRAPRVRAAMPGRWWVGLLASGALLAVSILMMDEDHTHGAFG